MGDAESDLLGEEDSDIDDVTSGEAVTVEDASFVSVGGDSDTVVVRELSVEGLIVVDGDSDTDDAERLSLRPLLVVEEVSV